MDESEKLTALKKAYADIILNTAKEAAARIMASERKAVRLQQELVSTKEESLRMLLRLKQMLDSKVKEAELTSLIQQKKIDELEAQLQEAEEIVRDLRAELREAQDELENVTNHHMHPQVEQNIEGQIAAHENFLQENRLDPYDASVNSAPDLQLESVSVSDTRNPTVDGINDSGKLCVSHDHTNNCYIYNPDFASIVIRKKEPELYRNGCTQRVRAFERSLYDGNMSASGNSDNLEDETLVRVHEEGKMTPVTTDTKDDNICDPVKPDELKVVKENDGLVNIPCRRKKRRCVRTKKTLRLGLHEECKTMPVTTDAKADNICEPVKIDPLKVVKENAGLVKILHHGKKRKFVRRKTLRKGLCSHKVKEINKTSNLANGKGSPCVLDKNDLSRVNSSILNENGVQKDLMSPPFAKPIDASATIEQSGSHSDTEKGEVFLKVCSAKNKLKDDKERLHKSDLPIEESLPTKSLEATASRADVEAANGSPDKLDPKASDIDVKASCQSVNDKFLKYTFRRKRKKESNGSADVDCSLESSSLKKTCSEKQNGHAEPQKSCTMTESSRDSRRLAQVARQLISLSEKKWWQ